MNQPVQLTKSIKSFSGVGVGKTGMIFFDILELIKVYSHLLTCILLCPKVSAKKFIILEKFWGKLILLI